MITIGDISPASSAVEAFQERFRVCTISTLPCLAVPTASSHLVPPHAVGQHLCFSGHDPSLVHTLVHIEIVSFGSATGHVPSRTMTSARHYNKKNLNQFSNTLRKTKTLAFFKSKVKVLLPSMYKKNKGNQDEQVACCAMIMDTLNNKTDPCKMS